MAHSFTGQIVLLIPVAGPSMQTGQMLRTSDLFKPVPKQIGEEGVITIPLTRFIQGHDKKVGLFQLLEKVTSVAMAP